MMLKVFTDDIIAILLFPMLFLLHIYRALYKKYINIYFISKKYIFTKNLSTW